jgi:hypothetical protein
VTHAEATKDDRKGFLSHCPGELVAMGTYPDRVLDAGRAVDRTVTPWSCECGKILPIVDETGEVLNCYEKAPEPPADRRPMP